MGNTYSLVFRSVIFICNQYFYGFFFLKKGLSSCNTINEWRFIIRSYVIHIYLIIKLCIFMVLIPREIILILSSYSLIGFCLVLYTFLLLSFFVFFFVCSTHLDNDFLWFHLDSNRYKYYKMLYMNQNSNRDLKSMVQLLQLIFYIISYILFVCM